MIEAQVNALVHAWEWRSTDTIYNPLPLHHVHGIINVLTCGLWSGARVEMPNKFDAADTVSVNVWAWPLRVSDRVVFLSGVALSAGI